MQLFIRPGAVVRALVPVTAGVIAPAVGIDVHVLRRIGSGCARSRGIGRREPAGLGKCAGFRDSAGFRRAGGFRSYGDRLFRYAAGGFAVFIDKGIRRRQGSTVVLRHRIGGQGLGGGPSGSPPHRDRSRVGRDRVAGACAHKGAYHLPSVHRGRDVVNHDLAAAVAGGLNAGEVPFDIVQGKKALPVGGLQAPLIVPRILGRDYKRSPAALVNGFRRRVLEDRRRPDSGRIFPDKERGLSAVPNAGGDNAVVQIALAVVADGIALTGADQNLEPVGLGAECAGHAVARGIIPGRADDIAALGTGGDRDRGRVHQGNRGRLNGRQDLGDDRIGGCGLRRHQESEGNHQRRDDAQTE